jgi:AcrR family transcriptional regulator
MVGLAKKSGRRAGGRTAYQAEQRLRTHENLMQAGVEIFSRQPYFDATIDELVRAAGISRATFYMHFESKLELAFAVFEAAIGEWMALFTELPAVVALNPSDLRAWMDRLLGLYRTHIYVPRLHAELDAFEPRFQARMDTRNDALIDQLGQSILAFAPALQPTPEGRRARIRAILLINHIGTVCASLASRRVMPDETIYLDVLTEDLMRFLPDGGTDTLTWSGPTGPDFEVGHAAAVATAHV